MFRSRNYGVMICVWNMRVIQNMESTNRWFNVYQKMDMTSNC